MDNRPVNNWVFVVLAVFCICFVVFPLLQVQSCTKRDEEYHDRLTKSYTFRHAWNYQNLDRHTILADYTTEVDDVTTQVFPTTGLFQTDEWCIYLANSGPDPLAKVEAMVGIQGTSKQLPDTWYVLPENFCDYLFPGDTCRLCQKSYADQYLQVQARTAPTEPGKPPTKAKIRAVFSGKRHWQPLLIPQWPVTIDP
jgi:hypothetical protein